MRKYNLVQIISGKGGGPDQFAGALRGIAIDQRDQLYAVGDSELKVFDGGGALRRRWTTSRPGFSVAIADDGSVYAGETGQVEIFDAAGKLSATWRDAGRLGQVTAIGFVNDNVLLGDASDRCIRRYDGGGRFLNNIGKDNRMKGFRITNGIVEFGVDDDGIIHATNPGKHRIERYTPEGELLGHIGRFDGRDPAGFSGCCNPTNLAVEGRERIYVTEKAGPRVKLLDSGGNLLAVIATDVFDPNSKNMDIAVDSTGRVFVVDTVRLEILVFAPADEQEGVPGT